MSSSTLDKLEAGQEDRTTEFKIDYDRNIEGEIEELSKLSTAIELQLKRRFLWVIRFH